jgi:hypothetical protein
MRGEAPNPRRTNITTGGGGVLDRSEHEVVTSVPNVEPGQSMHEHMQDMGSKEASRRMAAARTSSREAQVHFAVRLLLWRW